ncbi:alpha-trehalose phosphate synthase subunit [Penicillium cosmopolitanum]|uniref:Alpha-trehalose phosphate synthase subunit n=1 Tax=Penicillium cosmopolitanum TaxID=1131564 RepID=A0A9X0B3H8_9EURO|nr:alpha-trehalose phosphate synthase subunit [Penicillium cosmopolitanum]KAJ5386794.1 alpha-trehalose phosphate synthase subunit [Penicillium cosmopolitanum]
MAYELFLNKYPRWRDNVVLVQITASVSDIPELEAQVSKIAMRINSVYSTLTHQPLVLLQQDISYAQFLALLSVAEIFMATNLREGMNLTSHDFIHCQDGELSSQRYGSLILSEFTGSAAIFQGHELIVNPWDYKQCADAIKKALEMTPEQKKRNWKYLEERKTPYTALAWYSSLQTALVEAHGMQQSRFAHAIHPLNITDLQNSYNASQSRLLFIEDGAAFVTSTHPDLTYTSKEVITVLESLVSDPKNTVYLTSNRSPEQLDATSSRLPKALGIIAENGCFVKLPVIAYFAERTEGSIIEERRCTLTFHFADADDKETAARNASELADQINGARGCEAIRVVRDVGAVSVEPLYASKATAASWILNHSPDYKEMEFFEFVFVAGGARADEALFRWANRLVLKRDAAEVAVTTLTAGTHATEAKVRLSDAYSLSDVLRSLAST